MILHDVGVVRQIDFSFFKVVLRTDRIIAVKIISREDIDVSHVKQVIKAIEEIGEGKKYPLLIVVNELPLPTVDARNYLATPESNPYGTAAAYVVKSFPQRLVGNFYLNYNKPSRPTKIFNTEEKALEWLKTFL